MGTLRNTGSARLLGVALAIFVAVVLAGCGSSSSTTPTSTTPASSPSSIAEVPGSASSTSSTPSPPSAPSTIPRSAPTACSALASTLSISDLRLQNSGNWRAERQRILTDTASNVGLLAIAADGVPADVARALETLKGYSTWLGDTVAGASDFESADRAVNAYPDAVGISNATAVVDAWKRVNC